MISPLSRLASSNASLLLPAPVGPDITTTLCRSLFFVGGTAEQEVAKSLLALHRRQRRKGGTEGRSSGASAG